jgi:phage terminase large subunit-like protein
MSFSQDKALRAINFIELLKHTKGIFRGKNFKLLDWQHRIVSEVYGTMTEKNIRQYQYVYLEVPKKNGKSELVAAMGLYHTFVDGEMRGEIYGCAADRTQAALAFDVAVDMVDQNAFLKKQCKYTASKKELKDNKSGSIYKVLSAESYTKHGLNASCVIFDELHCQPNRDLWDVMFFGAGDAREQPILWVITTAGDDPDRHSIGWEIHEKATKIISGEILDPRWHCTIFGIPENYEGDIYDENLWYKVNPSLGHTIDIEKVRQAALGARNNPAEEKLFRWLRLNQWVSLKQIGWLELTLWDTTTGSWSISDLIGKKCYAGLDLASTTDLTGLALLFPPQEGLNDWRFILEAWVPEDNMKERVTRDHVPYDRWAAEKHLHVTSGNTCDYDFVRARIETLDKQFEIRYLCCDPWNSRMLTQQLEKSGMEIVEVPQTISGMSPGMKEIERLLKSGLMTHEKNPLGRWCFGNVNVAIDGNENMKPMKNKSRDRIDPIVALINAMNIAILKENLANKCPYNAERGILML